MSDPDMQRGMIQWKCPKCANRTYETEPISTAGGGWARFFNQQNKRFTAVVCTGCGYTELYRTKASGLSQVLDFLGSG